MILRSYIWIFLLISSVVAQGQGSFDTDIKEAKAISDDRTAQIEALDAILKKRKYSSYPDSLGLVHYAIAYRHRLLGEDIQVIEHAKKGVQLFDEASYKGYQKAFLYSFLGESYDYLLDPNKAIQAYDAILQLEPQGRIQTVYGYAALQSAQIYERNEDYKTSIDIIESVVEGPYKNAISDRDLMDLYLAGSISYSNLRNRDEMTRSKAYLDSAYRYANQIEDLDILNASELDNQAAILHIYSGDENLALPMFRRTASKLAEQNIDGSSTYLSLMYSNAAYASNSTSKYTDGLRSGRQAMSIITSASAEIPIELEVSVYSNLAASHRGLTAFDSAYYYLGLARATLEDQGLESDEIRALYITYLYDHALTNYDQFLIHNAQSLQEAKRNITQLDNMFQFQVDDQLSDFSVQSLRSKGTDYYKLGIDIAYSLGDIETYWTYSEKIKGLELLAANLANQNRTSSTAKKELDRQILELNALLGLETSHDKIDSLRLIRAKLKQEKVELTRQLATNQRSSAYQLVDLGRIRESLDQKQQLIQYQSGQKHLYGIVVTADTAMLKQLLTVEATTSLTNEFGSLIVEQNSPIEKIKTLGYQIYKGLVQDLTLGKSHTIIIHDEVTTDLPMDALITDGGEYWVRSTAMNTTPSGSFLIQNSGKLKSLRQIEYFKPAYTTATDLPPLPYTDAELTSVKEIFSVALVEGNNCTKSALDSSLVDAAVVHFSGHAIANSTASEQSYLALSSGSSLQDRLLLGELYTMSTSAQMVVLSACKTGIGQIIKGEGAESLARGFLYAGAKSVLNTLWSVDDRATSHIISGTYANLREGYTKSISLQQAKLAYLDKAESYEQHPYYWAGIVVTGADTPIKVYQINWWKHLLLLIILALLAAFLTWRHSKRPFPKIEFLGQPLQ
ncbi:MAG: CHAT domain-containing protein [Bacteroidota bacterium]